MNEIWVTMSRSILSIMLCITICLQPVFAEVKRNFVIPDEVQGGGRGSEITAGVYPGAVLMRIHLWGAVGKSGVFHIPTQTDLMSLLSYAGGPTDTAALDEVIIKRTDGTKTKIIRLDLEDFLEKPELVSPKLQANDIVYIPPKEPSIGTSALTTMGYITSVLGFILLSIAFVDRVK